jgi:hypothetical protein
MQFKSKKFPKQTENSFDIFEKDLAKRAKSAIEEKEEGLSPERREKGY